MLVLLSASILLAAPTVAAAVAAGPVQRRIVDDLTPALIEQLKAANISLLLVLPGSVNYTTMKLDWSKVTASVERFAVVSDYQEFHSQWQGFTKRHRREQQHEGHTAKPAPQEPPPSVVTITHGPHTLPKVALLIRADDGGLLHIRQSTLAAAITRHLRRLQVLTLLYSTHQAKGDSLLVFDGNGVPLQANFLATSVFRDAFSNIYDKKIWSEEGGGSGLGSSVSYTANVRAALPRLIKQYNISSMLDSSCGSMHWLPLVLKGVQQQKPDFKFMGTDVVCSLIDKHKQTYKDQPNMNFQCVDYANQPLPSGYDLVWSRDSLQHIPMHGAWQFLNNVKASGAKYLLVGSYVTTQEGNRNIAAGDYYPIDLLKEPFKVSQPLEIIDEKAPDGKHMLLFDVQKMTWQDPLADLV